VAIRMVLSWSRVYVVAVLKRPLEKAQVRYPEGSDWVLMFRHEPDGHLPSRHNQESVIQPYATKPICAVHFDLINAGTNLYPGREIGRRAGAEAMAKHMHVDLNTLSPAGGFMVAFQVAIYGGLRLASPFITYFIAHFIFPALK